MVDYYFYEACCRTDGRAVHGARHMSSRDYDFGELPSAPEMTWRVRHKRDNGVITSLPAAAAAAAASAAAATAAATRRRYRETEVAISGV